MNNREKTNLYHAEKIGGIRCIRISLANCRELCWDTPFEGWDDVPTALLQRRFDQYQRMGGVVDLCRGCDYKAGYVNKQRKWVPEQIEILPSIDNLPSKKVIALMKRMKRELKSGPRPGRSRKAPRSDVRTSAG